MTPEQNFQFRSLLSNLLNARTTGELDTRQLAHEDHLRNYIDGLLDEKDAEIAALKTENETLKTPMISVRFTQGENMYGEVYYMAELGKWEMELNTSKRDGWKFFLTVGTGNQKELSRPELDDLISLLLSSRIYTEQFLNQGNSRLP